MLVMVHHVNTIKAELEEDAMVDNCMRVDAMCRVMLPVAAFRIFTAEILAFVNSGISSCYVFVAIHRSIGRPMSAS